MKKTMMMLFTLLAVQVYGQSGPKVFLEPQEPSHNRKYSSASEIVSLPEITERFMKVCPECRMTIKKDAADFVVIFAASQAAWGKKAWQWTLYDKEGIAIGKGETMMFNNSIKDVVEDLRIHHIERVKH